MYVLEFPGRPRFYKGHVVLTRAPKEWYTTSIQQHATSSGNTMRSASTLMVYFLLAHPYIPTQEE